MASQPSIGQILSNSLLGTVGMTETQISGRQNVNSMFRYTMAQGAPATIIFKNENMASRDWRVRIGLAPGSNYFYNDGYFYPLF